MDIFDILLDILLKPPQPFIGLFFSLPKSLKRLHAARIDELADSNEPAIKVVYGKNLGHFVRITRQYITIHWNPRLAYMANATCVLNY